jgi:16S rRNA (cytosine967-C5)-methyltransferase
VTAVRRARPRTTVDAARQTAYDALLAVEHDGAYLNLALGVLLAERRITGRDAAFATELASGTARLQGTYDAILDSAVRGGVDALQPEVRIALRLSIHQLLDMRVASHAAVTSGVELTRAAAGERPVRLANAVLRKVADRSRGDWLAIVAPARANDLAGQLSVAHSHPRWVVQAFFDALDADAEQVEALLAADNVAPKVTLAVRPGLGDVDALVAAGAARGRWSPYAATLSAGDPGGLELVRSGRVGVQDEGSQLAAIALARAPVDGRDQRWLDLCAGPGGKAALLTGLGRERGATLVASERLVHRAGLVSSGLRAYRPPLPPVVAADGIQPPWLPSTFDRVLVDAPCTGLGALRRRPESRWRRGPADLPALTALQVSLLTSAIESVRPGGVVAYVTCSPHRAETRGVVDAVLRPRVDVEELDTPSLLPEVPDLGPGPYAQLWPHVHGTDAMFVSVLRRTAH